MCVCVRVYVRVHVRVFPQGLTVKEMEELREDIKMHLEFDRNNPMHVEFWTVRSLLHYSCSCCL